MCGFQSEKGKDGIKFKDGTFIPVNELILEELSAEHRAELDAMHIYNEIAVRKRLHDHGNNLQVIMNKLEDIRNNMLSKRDIEEIVINKLKSPEVDEIFEQKWINIFKVKIISAGNIAKAITAIILLLSLAGILLNMVKK